MSQENMNGHSLPEMDESFTLTDELDHEILMHRDAHFGGDFRVMLDYYMDDHVGVNPDFEVDRIEYLAQVEQELERNLAAELLSVAEAELIGRARHAYRELKALYEDEKAVIPRLIADLILSEEEEPEEAIAAIVSRGTQLVPELLALLKSDEAYNPLFPGYGYAPYLALVCLARIGDPSGIVPIFETLSKEAVFTEEAALDALKAIGEPAKTFLLNILASRPVTRDNVQAAFALTVFADDPEVAVAAFKALQDPEVQAHSLLSTYLLCCCEELKETPLRDQFLAMAHDPSVKEEIREEISLIAQGWT